MGNVVTTQKIGSKNGKEIGVNKYSIFMTLVSNDILLIETKPLDRQVATSHACC